MEPVITIKQFHGKTYWVAEKVCLSHEEAKAASAILCAMPQPEAFMPAFAPAIALADGEAATGGGVATHYVEPAPELSPALEALQERAEADDPQVGALKAGEAG